MISCSPDRNPWNSPDGQNGCCLKAVRRVLSRILSHLSTPQASALRPGESKIAALIDAIFRSPKGGFGAWTVNLKTVEAGRVG